MKKVIIALGCVAFFGLASCKKDYTCTCTIPNPLGGGDITQTYEYEDSKKGDAEDACDAQDQAAQVAGGSCELD